jgi:DNA mismatch repair protein MSH5
MLDTSIFILILDNTKMAYKRRRVGLATSSQREQASSRPQSVPRMGSVPLGIPPSSPRLSPLSQQNRISPQLGTSRVPTASSSTDQDIIQNHDETETEIQEREDLDALNEVIMAVEMKERGSVGCAYYIAREEKLCLMEEIKIAELENLDTLKIHVQPTVVLISTRCEEKLEEHLVKAARGINRGDDASKLISPRGLKTN